MNTMSLGAVQRQTQTVSPRLQHAVRLLQMSSLDFSAMVRDALSSNPFLEGDESDAQGDGIDGALPDSQAEDTIADDGELAAYDMAAEDRELWRADTPSTPRAADESELSTMERAPLETSLAAHLCSQLNVMPLPARDLALASALATSLDDDGFLRMALDEVVDAEAIDPPPDEEEMMIALRRVQALDPPGVGARNVGECLLLQMPGIACPRSARPGHAHRRGATGHAGRARHQPAQRGCWTCPWRASRPRATPSGGSTRGRAGASAARRWTTSCPT